MIRLLGYKKATSQKNGKPYCQLFVAESINDKESGWGYVGEKVNSSHFLPDDCINVLGPEDIGKEIELYFEIGYDMRAHISGIKVKK